MTTDQATAFAIIALGLVLFVWGRWRYDLVAVLMLVLSVAAGIVPANAAFSGFGNAAVITVVAVLIISRSLQRTGVADRLADVVVNLSDRPVVQIGALTLAVAVMSAFMNNVGALALMLPVTLQAADSHGIPPSRMLMPVAFGSLLGGMTTLIGTPPNIIIASYRADAAGAPFAMFDFAPVGVAAAVIGVAFIAVVGYRLLPVGRKGASTRDLLFEMKDYITEVRVPEANPLIGKPVRSVVVLGDGDVAVVALFRGGKRQLAPPWYEKIQQDDTLIIEGDPASLAGVLDASGLELAGEGDITSEALRSDEVVLVEAVVNPGSRLDGRTARGLRLNSRFGVNLLAVARMTRQLRQRVGHIRLRAGDVLLVQGPAHTMAEALSALGCLPLAERGLRLGVRRRALPLIIFAAAIVAAAFDVAPVDVAFVAAVALIILLDGLPLREAYDAVDWPVVVLLGAMLPVGAALETTGATGLVAGAITGASDRLPVAAVIVLIMIVAMLLSAVINNAATAVLMAPVAIGVARTLEASVDPFLMAVAIGSSSAFLTPIGHQSNLLVMVPGGYRFGDYWRLGLPLAVLVIAAATPVLLWVWPP